MYRPLLLVSSVLCVAAAPLAIAQAAKPALYTDAQATAGAQVYVLSLIHISEPTRPY